MVRDRVAVSGGKLALPRGAGPIDLRSEGPSGPCRTYRPGEVEWCQEVGRAPHVRVTVGGVLLNRKAVALLGGEGVRVRVGYDGVGRRFVFRPDEAGEYCIRRGGAINSCSLAAWLRERGLREGRYPLQKGDAEFWVGL